YLRPPPRFCPRSGQNPKNTLNLVGREASHQILIRKQSNLRILGAPKSWHPSETAPAVGLEVPNNLPTAKETSDPEAGPSRGTDLRAGSPLRRRRLVIRSIRVS